MQTILITGGTGFVGKALTNALLNKGYNVIVLTRNPKATSADARLTYAAWNVEKQTIDEAAIKNADYIIHLAGAGVADKRWTAKRKAEIVSSRIESGKLLVKALCTIPNRVKAVVGASAIGWYGPDSVIPNPKPFVETNQNNIDFLGETCKKWEDAIEPIKDLNKRLVKLRIGIVMGKEGGAFHEFAKPLRFGIASVLGSGRQMISWIHINDLVNLFITAIENENYQGVYNAVAPQPVSNKELILTMAKAKGKFYIPLPVPSFVLKLMLGEMSIEILKSTTVSAEKILKTGFTFQYPNIQTAMQDLVK